MVDQPYTVKCILYSINDDVLFNIKLSRSYKMILQSNMGNSKLKILSKVAQSSSDQKLRIFVILTLPCLL